MIGRENTTEITHFILLGFSDFPRIIVVLFVVFLVIYILTLTWNLSLLILIRMDSHLHTPMYFFLSNLPFIDICYVTSTAPKMLYDFFQDEVHRHGYECMLYGSQHYLDTVWAHTDTRPIWLAQYNDYVTYEGQYEIWQLSDSGRIDGIDGNVDLNLLYLRQ